VRHADGRVAARHAELLVRRSEERVLFPEAAHDPARILASRYDARVSGDDAALLEAWRSGDARAGRVLAERWFDTLYRFFANKVGPEVDDLIQDTLLACVEGKDRFEGRSSFRTWLLAVARNKLYRHWRDRRGVGDEPTVGQLVDARAIAADALAQHQEQKLLLRCLRSLPLDLQLTLELAYFEGLTDREVAEILEIPVGTLKSRLRKGRMLLDAAMAEVAGPELLLSTTRGFDTWVASMRAQLARRAS
jgi:RNA polymerase sigma factor (sigma-70 family)